MAERKLARIVLLDDVIVHPNADALELAIVGGWQCVVKKGEFQKGDKAIYIEVDAAVPLDSRAFEFLEGRNNVTLDGKRYARIKTIKLRKELSQGLVIPVDYADGDEGVDVTEALGIVKYEKPEEKVNNGGMGVKRTNPFPSFIPKTDQERIQNIAAAYAKAWRENEVFEKTFKLDGSSMTVWIKDGVVGVASRNVSFALEDVKKGFLQTLKDYVEHVRQRGFKNAKWTPVIKGEDNAFTQVAKSSGVVEALKKEYELSGVNIAFQGELVGPNIQGNFEGVDENQYFIYDVFNIDEQKYLLPNERLMLVNYHDLKMVPIAGTGTLPNTIAEALVDADGPSGLNGKYREGFVYKSLTRDFSFKVISNSYLLKEE